MINTYVIFLKDKIKRYQNIYTQCKKHDLNPIFINAIDFRNKTFENVKKYYSPPKSILKKAKHILTPAEIGCALSHRKIYKKIIENNLKYALILEDDAKFISNPNTILNNLDYIAKQISFDIIILGYVKILQKDLNYYYRKIPIKILAKIQRYKFGIPWKQYGCGTVAYIITNEGAKKMLSSPKVEVAADNWLYYEKNYKISVIHIRPSIFIEDSLNFKSTIRKEKNDFLKIKNSSLVIRTIKGFIKNFFMNILKLK